MKRLPLFEEKNSKKILEKQCDNIARAVNACYTNVNEPGWMNGLGGIICFFFHYSRYTGHKKYKDHAYFALERIFSEVEKGFSHPSFSTGLSGINWMFKYLGKQGFISPREADSFRDLNPMFEKFAISQIKKGNFDVLHGAFGIILALESTLSNSANPGINPNTERLIPLIKSELGKLSIFQDSQTAFRVSEDPIEKLCETNLGLAHGLPSILFNLSLIYKRTLDKPILEELIDPGMNFLLQHAIINEGISSSFPTRIINGKAENPSRMAWCYGDPGVAMAIYQIGENCSRPEWNKIALSILRKASIRQKQEETGVTDACLCHGSAGLALIYYSAAKKSGYSPFLETVSHWTNKTLEFGNNTNSTSGYLFKDGLNKYIPKYSFLEGVSGVGLTMLALLEGELPGWERGLML